ncbi:DNA methyltransferase [Pseudolabrys sp.]|uniref:DNA methyltransferase n=1 Tax=Pseudolabrys sp. TaxID=1960880 RepID=UPI003D0CB8D8
MSPTWRPRNVVIHGGCVEVMRRMAPASVDFVLTDPPYLVRYRDRHGRTVVNDDNDAWLKPAFAEMYRVLKPGTFCMSFYGWSAADRFIEAWREAGFRIVGHVVFRKRYASSVRYLRYQHEQAYLLAKGAVRLPDNPPGDVADWIYTGNKLHPTQKSAEMLKPFIQAFCPEGGVVFDPFCGSGSTLVAARVLGRAYFGFELSRESYQKTLMRLAISGPDELG